jgi:hypothetical protein
MKNKLSITFCFILFFNSQIVSASIISEIPAIAKKIGDIFKKNSDDVPSQSSLNQHLNEPNRSSPLNSGVVEKHSNDVMPFSANYIVFQSGKCVANKLKADPKTTNKEAENFCKRAFYSCVSVYKNSLGYSDSKCLSSINDGFPYQLENTGFNLR